MCGPPQEPRGGVAGDRKPSGEACSQLGRYFRCGLWTSGGFSCLVHDEVISLRRDLGASAPSFSSLTPPTGRGDTDYQVAESALVMMLRLAGLRVKRGAAFPGML